MTSKTKTKTQDAQVNTMESEYGPEVQTIEAPKSIRGSIRKESTQKQSRDYTVNDTNIALMEKYGTKARAIRALKEEGKTVGQIADLLNIRYQHVRNEYNRELKKA